MRRASGSRTQERDDNRTGKKAAVSPAGSAAHAGRLVAVGYADGGVKGYLEHPHIELPIRADGKLDVGGAVGRVGRLSVVRDSGLREPYVGQCELVSGEIGEDMAMYFTVSEQTPSLVSLGVLVARAGAVLSAGGLLVQAMPGCSEHLLTQLELRAPIFADLSRYLAEQDDVAAAFHGLFRGLEPEILDMGVPVWRCDCDRARIDAALISLGADELSDMAEKDGGAEVGCHFCNTRYHFTVPELHALRGQGTNGL